MSIDDILAHKDDIISIASKHGAGNVRLFGSHARREATEKSDIDLLVSIVGKTSAWFPAGLALELEALLGCHVDIVTENGLNDALRPEVQKEAIAI